MSIQPNFQAPPARFRLRVRYAKRGRLRYLGHLEVIHTVERIVRRAGLPYAVSQGFSPHMRVGYTAALPVGTSSTCEYYDVFLTDLVPVAEALARLQAASPEDLAPDAAAYIDLRTPALTAQIRRVDYLVALTFRAGHAVACEQLERAVGALATQGQIPFSRGRKRKVLDLARSLVNVEARVLPDGSARLTLRTVCDNDGALRPEIYIAALDQALRGLAAGDEEIESTGIQDLALIERYRVERTGQFIEEPDGTLRAPLAGPVAPPTGTLSAALDGSPMANV